MKNPSIQVSASVKKYLPLVTLRLSSVALQFLIISFVGREAGPQGIGLLQLFTACICILGEIIAAGLPTHAMKNLSNDGHKPSEIRQFLCFCAQRIGILWLVLVFICCGLITVARLTFDSLTLPWLDKYIVPLALSVLAFSLIRLASESLKAQREVNVSVFLENTVPAVTGLGVLACVWLYTSSLNSTAIILSVSIGYFLSAILLLLTLHRHLQSKQPLPRSNTSAIRTDWKLHSPFWVTAIVSITFLNFPFLVMPYFSSLVEIGNFALAFKLVNTITIVLVMIGAVFGPKFARCKAKVDFVKTKSLLIQTQWITLCVYLPGAVFLLTFFKSLHTVFGDGFEGAYFFLVILALAQGVNAATGLAGLALNMLGKGRIEMWIQVGSLAFVCVAAPIAGLTYGAAGVVTIYATALAIKSLLSRFILNRLLRNLSLKQNHNQVHEHFRIGEFA